LQAGEFAIVETATDANAINRNTVAQEIFDGIGIRVAIGLAVLAVGDKENHFAAVAAALFEELCGFENGVVESFVGMVADNHSGRRRRWGARANSRLTVDGRATVRAASSGRSDIGAIPIDASTMNFSEQLILIAGEAFAGMKTRIEAADEGFVVGGQSGNDGRETGFDLFGVFGL
jgi:hypothetical protein